MNIRTSTAMILLASFVGIMANPEMLSASNSVAVSEINRVGIVKTEAKTAEPMLEVPQKPVFETEKSQPVLSSAVNNILEKIAPVASATEEPETEEASPVDNIQIAGRTLEIVTVGSTEVDSGNHVNKYGSKFYWGHNSAAVFRGLYNLGAGDTFAMTENGVMTKYRVAKVEIFEKNFETGTLQLDGKGNYMLTLINGRYEGKNYDVVLMTCYGTLVGNGDATNRYVIFAKAI